MRKILQKDLIMEYFINHANQDIPHSESVKWVVAEYAQRTGKVFLDPDRGIRKLYQQGVLKKVSKGIYRYDPEHVSHRELEDFTSQQREAIFKEDGYRCVICGLGRAEGMEIHADHIKPKDLGGKAEIENGQTLCAVHNLRKKNYGQYVMAKKMFIRLYNKAKASEDVETIKFCTQVLEVFERNNVDGHIEWKR
jgi:predicted restriction endonuclease